VSPSLHGPDRPADVASFRGHSGRRQDGPTSPQSLESQPARARRNLLRHLCCRAAHHGLLQATPWIPTQVFVGLPGLPDFS
jgi:hypothetical protein